MDFSGRPSAQTYFPPSRVQTLLNSVAKASLVQRRSTIFVTIAVANDDIKLLSPEKD